MSTLSKLTVEEKARPNLCSLRGVCSFDAHPLVNLLCLAPVLIFRTVDIFVIPLIVTLFSRLLRFVASYIINLLTFIKFTDAAFPPTLTSIGDLDLEDTGIEDLRTDVEWVRATDLDPSIHSVLFNKKINPRDLTQGVVGDCWLVAALANLAEYPAAIRNCFVNLERTARGKYSIRLFDPLSKKWETIVIDDFIPVMKEREGGVAQPLSMKPTGSEIWALLIEKALAKFCGSYSALVGGSSGWAWHVLTGDPVFVLEKNTTGDEFIKQDFYCGVDPNDPTNRRYSVFYSNESKAEKCHRADLFGVLEAYLQRRCPVGAAIYKSSAAISREEGLECGLLAGHAYSVLDVRRLGRSLSDTIQDTFQSGYTLVKLRNPHGSAGREWKGNWSDNCPRWEAHPEIAKEAGFVKADDGVFWMGIEDFWTYFDKVYICDRSNKRDLRLNTYEEMPVLGPFYGFLTGIGKFWCLCRGIRVLYCGHHPGAHLQMSDNKCGCVPADVKDTLRGASREIQHMAGVVVVREPASV
jgi:hypothetical protein